jgi:hypothetical protein
MEERKAYLTLAENLSIAQKIQIDIACALITSQPDYVDNPSKLIQHTNRITESLIKAL